MAEELRKFYDADIVRSIAASLGLDESRFVRACIPKFRDLSLTERAWHIAEVMRKELPADDAAAIEHVITSLGPEHSGSESFGLAPFRYLPHVFFVARYGLEHFELSMRAQYELTKRFSSEYSIRAFLLKYPERTMSRLFEWARDPNVHVRRLVSEGTRPLLPWAPRLRGFQEDPRPVIELLEILKDDPERYVQRSVANNLNDISKDHPDLVVDLLRRWLEEPTAQRRWIAGHAMRTLIKRGNRRALELSGFSGAPRIRVTGVKLPKRVRIGDTLSMKFDIVSSAAKEQEILVDYVIEFVKANGERSPKVFKLRSMVLPPKGRVTLSTRTTFADLTTRKHYRGVHRARLLVNGRSYPLGEFKVV